MSQLVILPPETELLPDGAKLGGWWHAADDTDRVVCDLCPRACNLKPGDRGFCFVRENRDGRMVLGTYGRSTGFCIDPIEKKPLNHFFPGTSVLSFGTAGCNLGCKFCQNWDISKSREVERLSEYATPEMIAEAARQLDCLSVAYTYNDPVIWAEYAIDTARACRAVGVRSVAVTAGYITPAAREAFFREMDAANVDLKAFTEEFYFKLTYSHLQPVLDTLHWLKHETDVWFEITNLVIPGENDSADELRSMCDWILASVGDEVPVHFSAFHPDFRMRDKPRTPIETLLAAYDIARRQGIKYAYVGNVDDVQHQSTYCPHCGELLIERNWYDLGVYRLRGDRCGQCGGKIAGRFQDAPGDWGRKRLPVRISQFAGAASKPPKANQENQGKEHPMAAKPETGQKPAAAQAADPGNVPTSPEVTAGQEAAIHRAACEVVAAGVQGHSPRLSDPTLAGCAGQMVMGAFVTLKRSGRLRACCGVLGRPMRVLEAVQQSALRTATEDSRFPTISPTELPHLHLDVTLLYGFQPIEASGRRAGEASRGGPPRLAHFPRQLRRAAAARGRRGKRLGRGGVPGARLPQSRLADDRLAGRRGAAAAVRGPHDRRRIRSRSAGRDDERKAAAVRCGRPAAAGRPMPPERAGLGARRHAQLLPAGLSGRHGRSHRAVRSRRRSSGAVHVLADVAAARSALAGDAVHAVRNGRQDAGRQPSGPRGPEPHPGRADAAVRSGDARHGGGTRSGRRESGSGGRCWSSSTAAAPGCSIPAGPSRNCCKPPRRRPRSPAPRRPRSSAWRPNRRSVRSQVSSVPRPRVGPQVRPPAVAGAFYPGEPSQLRKMIDDLLADGDVQPAAWPGILVPHAGLIYSGRLAAQTFRRVRIPETVIIIAPKHTRQGVDFAVAPHDTWSLPGGSIASDPELARRLAAEVPGLQLDAAAHQQEHAIEVQLPILARLAPHSTSRRDHLGSRRLGPLPPVGRRDWPTCCGRCSRGRCW